MNYLRELCESDAETVAVLRLLQGGRSREIETSLHPKDRKMEWNFIMISSSRFRNGLFFRLVSLFSELLDPTRPKPAEKSAFALRYPKLAAR